MTMHGEIKVNDMVFGTWAASNDPNNPNIYDCSFVWMDMQGYWFDAVWSMSHSIIGHGPLAPRVITEGYKRMKRRTYSD